MVKFRNYRINPAYDMPYMLIPWHEALDMIHPDAAVLWDRDAANLHSPIRSCATTTGSRFNSQTVSDYCNDFGEIELEDHSFYRLISDGPHSVPLQWILVRVRAEITREFRLTTRLGPTNEKTIAELLAMI